MVYSTPELLLIGAAQNLVLSGLTTPVICEKGADVQPGASNQVELW